MTIRARTWTGVVDELRRVLAEIEDRGPVAPLAEDAELLLGLQEIPEWRDGEARAHCRVSGRRGDR